MGASSALRRRLLEAGILVAAVALVATVGYVAFEGWSWFEGLYMAVTTIWTVGGGEARPLHLAGKLWTLAVVVIGFGALTYFLLVLVSYGVEGGFTRGLEVRRRRARAARMKNHYILCGYGRVGREIAREFAGEGLRCVVVDNDPPSLALAERDGNAVVLGDAANVDTLHEAGIAQARGLITAVDSDPDNIYVTLSARVLNPSLFIVARANAPDAEAKLRFAGANRVVFPYALGGRRLAALAMRPTSVEFVDTVLSAGNGQLLLEDITISETSPWAGRALSALAPETADTIVLALKRADVMRFRPPASEMLTAGDELVVAGPPAAIRALEERLAGS